MKILLFGSNGQLGQTLINTCPEEIQIIKCYRDIVDLTDLEKIYDFIIKTKANFVINSAAFTAVDNAEIEPELAFRINSEAPKVMANAVSKIGSILIQISTDFVFDGTKNTPYIPKDHINPIGIYGKSKAKGEEYVLKYKNTYVIRTSWLYGDFGKNFCLTMLKLHKEKSLLNEPLRVISDQIGAPTSTYSLSRFCWKIINFLAKSQTIPSLLHWCDAGVASWYDFAFAIGELGIEKDLIAESAKVIPIKSIDHKTTARRPHFSLLNCEESVKILKEDQFHWRSELKKVIDIIKAKEIL